MPLPRSVDARRPRVCHRALQLSLSSRPDRHDVPAESFGALRPLHWCPTARRNHIGHGGVVLGRGARPAVVADAPCLALSGAVPIIQKMETLDVAALLARCRISDHLRGIRKTLITAYVGYVGG